MRVLELEAGAVQAIDIVDDRAEQVPRAEGVDEYLHAFGLEDVVVGRGLFGEVEQILKTRAAAAHHAHAKRVAGEAFLHAVAEGPASRSYGLQVARLAGVPAEVGRLARQYLGRIDRMAMQDARQQSLFAAPPGSGSEPEAAAPVPRDVLGSDLPEAGLSHELEQRLATVDPDALSPRDALALVYELKRIAGR